jgi:hypothetical protein
LIAFQSIFFEPYFEPTGVTDKISSYGSIQLIRFSLIQLQYLIDLY